MTQDTFYSFRGSPVDENYVFGFRAGHMQRRAGCSQCLGARCSLYGRQPSPTRSTRGRDCRDDPRGRTHHRGTHEPAAPTSKSSTSTAWGVARPSAASRVRFGQFDRHRFREASQTNPGAKTPRQRPTHRHPASTTWPRRSRLFHPAVAAVRRDVRTASRLSATASPRTPTRSTTPSRRWLRVAAQMLRK